MGTMGINSLPLLYHLFKMLCLDVIQSLYPQSYPPFITTVNSESACIMATINAKLGSF